MLVAVLGLSLAAVSGGAPLSLKMPGFSLQWLLLWWYTGSRVHGLGSTGQKSLSCPPARVIFPDQGSNWYPLHCKVDS